MTGCSTWAAAGRHDHRRSRTGGAGGWVLGVDISAPVLAPARKRLVSAGLNNVELLEVDAQVHPFETASFDAVISQFGTMFFEDPEAAFANLHRALRPAGRLAFVCWLDALKTEWAAATIRAAAPYMGLPDMGPPGAPGPFALADGDRLRELVRAGGFRDVTLEDVTRPERIGDDLDNVIGFITSLAEVRRLFTGKPANKGDRRRRGDPRSPHFVRRARWRRHGLRRLARDRAPLTADIDQSAAGSRMIMRVSFGHGTARP